MRKVMFMLASVLVLGVSAQRALVVEGNNTVAATEPVEYLYPGMLPDNPLYFLKDLKYKIQGLFVFGEANQADWYLKLADKRLGEIRSLTEKGKLDLVVKEAILVSDMSQKTQGLINTLDKQGKDTTLLVVKLRQNSERQQAVLNEVLVKVPQPAKGAIISAIAVSSRGLQQAIVAQEKQRPATPSSQPGKQKPGTTPVKGKAPK